MVGTLSKLKCLSSAIILSYHKLQKSDVIPSLPKPKSSVSPKLGRSTPTNAQAEASKPSNGSADLLGLDTAVTKTENKPSNNDDIFSSFFSAPQEKPAEPKLEEQKPDLKAEEENFFKQAAPTEKEKSKLTKDSILALYSQTPSTNLGNQFNPVQPAQPAYFGSFQAPPQYSNMPVQNGMQFNQFQPMNSQFQQGFGAPAQQPMPSGQFPQNNQFFNQPQQQLSQQFGGLNLGQSFPNAFAQTNSNVASNTTWQ